MSLEKFDQALKEKLLSVYPNVIFSSLSEAIKHSADNEIKSQTAEGENRDKKKSEKIVSLPLIAFDRINNPFAFERAANDPSIRRGRRRIREEELVGEKAFPVDIHYQIDIVSDKRREVDGIWRELVMFLHNHNGLNVHYDYGEEGFDEQYVIHLMDTDNTTDVTEFQNVGRIYRQTIDVEIPDARMLFVDKLDIVKEFPVRVIELEEDEDV